MKARLLASSSGFQLASQSTLLRLLQLCCSTIPSFSTLPQSHPRIVHIAAFLPDCMWEAITRWTVTQVTHVVERTKGLERKGGIHYSSRLKLSLSLYWFSLVFLPLQVLRAFDASSCQPIMRGAMLPFPNSQHPSYQAAHSPSCLCM